MTSGMTRKFSAVVCGQRFSVGPGVVRRKKGVEVGDEKDNGI